MFQRKNFALSSYLFVLFFFHNHAFSQDYFYQHQKISSKSGNLRAKLSREDHFGASLAYIGDLDGDGVGDMAVGAPGDDDGFKNAGAVWILFLDKNGSVRKEQKISMEAGGFEGRLSDDGGFGWAVSKIGDINGDMIPDIAVGETGNDDGGIDRGAVWILFLKDDGTVGAYQKISSSSGNFSGQLCKGFRFGAAITAVDDMDGDGVIELAVATGMEVEAAKGEFWLLNLTKEGKVKKEVRITEGQAGYLGKLNAGDYFASALCNIGDLDGDGLSELAIGAQGDNDGGPDNGAVYILFWERNGTIREFQKISTLAGGFDGKLDNGDNFGVSIAAIGDWNGDSIPDMAVGSYHDDDDSPDRGAVWVLCMEKNGKVKKQHKISGTTSNFRGELMPRYEWGRALCGLKDFNDDGILELVVSGHLDNDGGLQKGAYWLLYPENKERQNFIANNESVGSPKSIALIGNFPDSMLNDSDYDLSGTPENHILFLLDVSASMKKSDRLPLLRDSFLRLLKYMRPVDRVSVITYSGTPKIVLEAVPAIYRDSIAQSIERLVSKGSTKTYKALKQAYQLSENHFLSNGNNRIILATDGGFEISELFKLTEKYGHKSLPVSVFYFGKQPPHKKKLLEELADSAYGNCAHILPQKVDVALLRELKGIRLAKKTPEPIEGEE